MKTITTLISMLLMLVLFTGCDDDTTEPVTPANFAGDWTVTVTTSPAKYAPIKLTIVQSGNNVSGTIVGEVISGTVTGNNIKFSFDTNDSNKSIVTLTGTLNGNTINGTWVESGTNPVTGTWTATRGWTQPASLEVFPDSLSFGYVESNTTSIEKSFQINFANLTSALVISAPTGFEISKTSGSGFTSSLSLTSNSSNIVMVNIFVRFKPTTILAYSGNITCASGSVSQNVRVSGSSIQTTTAVIMPLTIGNQWTYADSTFDDSHNLQNVDSSKLGITGKTTISYNGQNVELFYWDWFDMQINQPSGYNWLCRNESDGLNEYGAQIGGNNTISGRSLMIKYPANSGDTWDKIVYSYDGTSFSISDTTTYTCVSTNEIVRTPVGNLECYVYKYSNVYDTYLYFSKNIGYVGFVMKVNGVILYKKSLVSKSVTKFAAQSSRKGSSQKQNKKIYSQFGIPISLK